MTGNKKPIKKPELKLIEEFRKQLEETKNLRKDLEAAGFEDFASKVTLESVEGLEQEIENEIAAYNLLDSDADAEFVIEGPPVEGTEVYVDFLGSFLQTVQYLVYAVANAMAGKVEGRPRKKIVGRNKLLAGFATSSFGVRVKLAKVIEVGEKIVDVAEPTALETVCELLGDDSELTDYVDYLNHPSVQNHYSGILGLIVKARAEVKTRYKLKPRGVCIASELASERIEWLESFTSEEGKPKDYQGRLVGGSIIGNSFELRVNGKTFRGAISEVAKEKMKKIHWGDMVIAKIKTSITKHEKTDYRREPKHLVEDFELLPSLLNGE